VRTVGGASRSLSLASGVAGGKPQRGISRSFESEHAAVDNQALADRRRVRWEHLQGRFAAACAGDAARRRSGPLGDVIWPAVRPASP